MARPQRSKKPTRSRLSAGRGPASAAPAPAAPGPGASVPPALREVIDQFARIVRESPDGWGTVAEVLKERTDLELEPLLAFLARHLGREVLPLLRGAALDEDDRLATAALRLLPTLGTRAAAEVLAEAYAARPEGERGRLARVGIGALQARGIAVALPGEEGAPTPAPSGVRLLREVWATLPDGVGSRSLCARSQDAYGVWRTSLVVWNDRAGVKEAIEHPQSYHAWERYLRDSAERGLPLVGVPAEYAAWEVAQARALNEQTGLPLTPEIAVWDRVVGAPPEGYAPPDPREQVRALSAEARAALVARLPELTGFPPLTTWAIEPADCRPWFDAWRALAEEEAQPGEADARRRELLAEIARNAIPEEERRRYVERLVETSRKLRWGGRDDLAGIAAAVALQIEEAADPGEVELFQQLADRGLHLLAEIVEEGQDPEALRYDPLAAEDEGEAGATAR